MFDLTYNPRKPILKTLIIGSDSRKSASSGIKKGLVGGLLFGLIGGYRRSVKCEKQNLHYFFDYLQGQNKGDRNS